MKDYRKTELKMYLIANIAILFAMQGMINGFFNGESVSAEKLLASTLLSIAAFFITLVSEGIFNSKTKDKILTLFGLIPLPGMTIFTRIGKKDIDKRYSKYEAKRCYEKVYTSLEGKALNVRRQEENSAWYKIYSKYKEDNCIALSQKEWLMWRDIFISTITLTIFYLTFSLIFKLINFDWRYIVWLSVLIMITDIGAYFKARTFVENVIAIDLVKFSIKKDSDT